MEIEPKNTGRKTAWVGLLVIILCFTGGLTAWAAISKTCSYGDFGCHQESGELAPGYEGNQGCINCHSSGTSSTTYIFNPGGDPEIVVPVVYYTGDNLEDDDPILAGGNFFWVQTDDSKGHNIFPSNPEDDLVDGAPFQAGTSMGCSWDASCHRNFDLVNDLGMPGLQGRRSCLKCHMLEDYSGPIWEDDGRWHSHHRDDSNLVVGSEINDGNPDGGDGSWDPEDGDGYFRFLRGHQSGDGHGVCGIEDGYGPPPHILSSSVHSEYLGFSGTKTSVGNLSALGHTATGFCCGCHGIKHISQDPGSDNWIRHPSGAFPLDALYTQYNPQNPVSRPDLNGYTGPSSTVTPATDMVMCLSCHRAHGSPYPKMLRWETVGGCDDCHISTTQCGE